MIGATKILCPVDFSAMSARALQYSIGISVARRIPLLVMTVLEAPFRYLDISPPTTYDLDRTRDALREFVREQLPTASRWKPEYDVSVETGTPADEIARVAAETGSGLLVMATHGRTGVGKWLFGSTTERLMRRPPCPLLAVARTDRELVVLHYENPRFAVQRILVATDFSDDSARALGMAADISDAFGAEILLAHVVPEIPPFALPSEAPFAMGYEQSAVTAAERRLDAMLAGPPERWRRASTLLLRGEADVELLRVATERQIDLIVMGAAGQGGVHHNPTSLTTYRVVSHSRCPVLVVASPPHG